MHSCLLATVVVAAFGACLDVVSSLPNIVILKDTDFPNCLAAHDPFPSGVSSLESCVQVCKERGAESCVAVTWVQSESQASCQLKCSHRNRLKVVNRSAVIVVPDRDACPGPSQVPEDWSRREAAGTMVIAGPREAGGRIANGYVGAYTLSLPGSIGPPQSGVEYIAGAYAGSSSSKPPFPKWPNVSCESRA